MDEPYSSTVSLSVIICAHNPREDHLLATLASLSAQRRLPSGTEFILIDNASQPPLVGRTDLSALLNYESCRVVREERLGLTFARIRAFSEACSATLVFLDDDNVLAPDYLRLAYDLMSFESKLGALGGKSIPKFEVEPPDWFKSLGISLACRDLGNAAESAGWINDERFYPPCSPIGAGMVIRKEVLAHWVEAVTDDAARRGFGRRGRALSSGEDNDIVLTALGNGWRVGYHPELSLTHLIPRARLTSEYLERYVESSNRSWVEVLNAHGIRPWRPIPGWSLPFRRARAYITSRAWRSPAHRIRWRAKCGLLAGQASIIDR